jgi:hypothetical protein
MPALAVSAAALYTNPKQQLGLYLNSSAVQAHLAPAQTKSAAATTPQGLPGSVPVPDLPVINYSPRNARICSCSNCHLGHLTNRHRGHEASANDWQGS